MPEIAEVEIVRRRMAPLLGRTIMAFTSFDSKWDNLPKIQGTVIGLRRQGKLLGIDLTNNITIQYHLMMNGNISWNENAKFTRGRLDLKPKHNHPNYLNLVDSRHFATLKLVDSQKWGQDIGPDLWTANLKTLALKVSTSRKGIKAQILDQRFVAGIGNYIADEALWRTKTHPHYKTNQIGYEGILCTLIAAKEISLSALSIKTPEVGEFSSRKQQWVQTLNAYHRAGKECKRCNDILIKGVAAGRGSVWCPTCQPVKPTKKYLGQITNEYKTRLSLQN